MAAWSRRSTTNRVSLFFVVAIGILVIVANVLQETEKVRRNDVLHSLHSKFNTEPASHVPSELIQLGVYSNRDFAETKSRRAPPFWNCLKNQSDAAVCNQQTNVWGPCYAPMRQTGWQNEVEFSRANNHTAMYHDKLTSYGKSDIDNLSDYCKPGFLIIGAGKCGTSSLYHYITSHPRVLPALEKQIHYFKYYYEYPFKWYLRHFSTATSFLANGALLTGEASPGYLPYPDVVNRVRQALPGARIIVIGRNPLERAYSSYRYNYVEPTVEEMYKGRVPHVRAGRNKFYYEEFLFSFQDLVEAELDELRKCMNVSTGAAVVNARSHWSRYAWVREEVARREQNGLPPMVDLDGSCYGKVVNSTVPREQWIALTAKYPNKVMTLRNLHLKQALIGRSLYFAPLEWWYAGIQATDIFFMCTEELRDLSGAPLESLGRFLGLPFYNFSNVLQEGAFNVGGHRGYDEEVSWQEVSSEAARLQDIPLSEDIRGEVLRFVQPYNERLFKLVGRRCDW